MILVHVAAEKNTKNVMADNILSVQDEFSFLKW